MSLPRTFARGATGAWAAQGLLRTAPCGIALVGRQKNAADFVRMFRAHLWLGNLFHIMEIMRKREYLGQLELMVLLAVVRPSARKAYGISIAHDIAGSGGRQVALASVYAALERLERKGFVVSSLGEPRLERGGKARTYFRPTPAGIKEARETHAMLMRLSGSASGLGGEPA